MAKILFFNFDGTDNEPADAMQNKNVFGTTEDDSITNILKFHLLIGGKLTHKCGSTKLANGSHSFYFNGVGTYGNYFQRKYNAALAKESLDVAKILRMAKKRFKKLYTPENSFDYVVLTGFSRGAALARRFALLINDQVKPNTIIEGVFDTVASIGMPNMKKQERPSSDVVFEYGHTLPSNVLKALHLLSLDDKRKAFQPTLMNQDSRVEEVWFAGAHSDVGGGYNFDGLSDNSLRYFLDWFEDQPELKLSFLSCKNVDCNTIFTQSSKLNIGKDDLQIDPNPLGVNHQQDRLPIFDRLTLTDRVCCVIQEDQIQQEIPPKVHWSVAERIRKDRNYRPPSLHNRAHYLQYQDKTELLFDGAFEHKLISMGHFQVLDLAQKPSIETRAYAHFKYNHTGVYLEAGKTYQIEVIDLPNQKWKDGSIQAVDGEGWNRDDVRLGLKEIAIAAAEPFRRVTKKGAQWFSLCGCIGDEDTDAFVIGNKLEQFIPVKSGELCVFANDLNGYYGNNSGYLKIRITLV